MQSILTSKNIPTHRLLKSILAYTARLTVLSPVRCVALRYVAVRYVALRLVIEKACLVLLLTVRLLLAAFCPQIDFSSKHNTLSMMLTNVNRDFFLGRLIKIHYGFYYQWSHRNRKAFKLTSISPWSSPRSSFFCFLLEGKSESHLARLPLAWKKTKKTATQANLDQVTYAMSVSIVQLYQLTFDFRNGRSGWIDFIKPHIPSTFTNFIKQCFTRPEG